MKLRRIIVFPALISALCALFYACATPNHTENPRIIVLIACKNASVADMERGANALKTTIGEEFGLIDCMIRSSNAMCQITVEVPPPFQAGKTAAKLRGALPGKLHVFPDGARIIGFRTIPFMAKTEK